VACPASIAIVGASLAGGTAAVTLRDEGFDGRVVLIGAEAELPYERPPLSKEYLRGERELESFLVRKPEVWSDLGVELRLGTPAASIDAAARDVVLADGERISYDAVLVAAGGRPRRPPIPGIALPGIHDLRSVSDADAIRAGALAGRRACVVGMGFIGSETAASLRGLGLDVVAVEPFAAPLERVLGAEVGGVIAQLHRERGVDLRLGESVAAFEGGERVQRVVTSSGASLECDLVVLGVGIEPAVDVVAATGVALDNGILVDELCRTSIDGIYAAGDVANHRHPLFGRIRVEHWLNAIEQGAAAARSMIGKGSPYAELHWFWSDQYDANIQYAGYHTRWDDLVVRGSLAEGKFVAFYVEAGVVRAVAAVNSGRDVRRGFGLIRSQRPVDLASLRDPDVDLRTLAPKD
jgi:3-phenylpropionate/trans-cinnamate dioxygenase ferredoxin reductase component